MDFSSSSRQQQQQQQQQQHHQQPAIVPAVVNGIEMSTSIAVTADRTQTQARSLDLEAQAASLSSLLTGIDAKKSSQSIDSNSSSIVTSPASSSTTSSAPQYSDDLRQALSTTLNLVQRQGSVTSTKTCEVDLGDEERDTFSPISSSSNGSPSDVEPPIVVVEAITATSAIAVAAGTVVCNGSSTALDFDNKIYDTSILPAPPQKHKQSHGLTSLHTATKAEKQRQNEEIVIMETSSISSETGSWESVFPHNSTTPTATTGNVTIVQINKISTPIAGSSASALNFPSLDLRSCCTEFLHNERQPHWKLASHLHAEDNFDDDGDGTFRANFHNTNPFKEPEYATDADNVSANISSLNLGAHKPSLIRDLDKCENIMNTSGTSACFIDASSLRDEDEVLSFPSLDGQHTNDDGLAFDVAEHLNETTTSNVQQAIVAQNEKDDDDDDDDSSPTKKLEAFHKAFAKCKVKSETSIEVDKENGPSISTSASSNSGADSPQKEVVSGTSAATSINNLSDEEKLWKREHNSHRISTRDDLKLNSNSKEITQPTNNNQLYSTHEDATEASVSLAADVDSSDSSEVIKSRRELERKPGPFSFQHHLQHFTVHPLSVSPKFPTHVTQQPSHSDLSYTTDYSSSSPAPSLVWSEHEIRPNTTNGGGNSRYHHSDDLESHLLKSNLLPDTPHNSIAPMDGISSNTSSIHRDYTPSSSFSHHRDSGAYCSDATDSPIPLPRTPRRSKFDEANPIISGGASFKDFSIKQCESPPVTRRTETCPIVSGGFVSLDFEQKKPVEDDKDEEVEMRPKPMTRKPLSVLSSWVVDMSDCRPERCRSTSSTSSLDNTTGRERERSDSTSSHKSGLGFFVSLDDMESKPEKPIKAQSMSKSYTAPKSSGFFVNLSKSEYQPKDNENLQLADEKELQGISSSASDKKNIFSMFIDLNDEKKSSSTTSLKKEPFNLAQRLSSSIASSQRRSESGVMHSSASSTETLMSKSYGFKKSQNDDSAGESKSLDYSVNYEAPITVAALRRLSQQQRAQHEANKRHSWGNNPAETPETAKHDYKRSISLTANVGDTKENDGMGLMSIIDKLPIISKASSMSVNDSSSLSPYDEYMGSKSELSTFSNHSARNSMSGCEKEEDVALIVDKPALINGTRIKKRRRDVQINETFDKSSIASLTDGVLSKDLSPASNTDTDDLTFQQDEELVVMRDVPPVMPPVPQVTSNRSSAIIMETIVETKETSSPKKNANDPGHTMESLHATIEKQKMLLETVNEHVETTGKSSAPAAFVKLSDMDKPVKIELQSPEPLMSKSAGNHRQLNRLYRDETKARPHSWTMTRSQGNSFFNITNSVDNLRSLSRLFPNYSKELSNSLPTDITLDQVEYIQTDLSADSSLASSFSRSGMDESSISCRQPRRLGEDLLKMFLQELATDMVVDVHGRRIKAHKCILRSRCQYFAAMLAGSSSQSIVSLQGYSFSAVHFALCHIYSGASHPPDGISLMELAALADLLGLEGLKEVTAHALKTNYCHNFHKPCSGCIDGILQVLPVALNHALDDLYRKCLRWTCRHYLKVWPTRQFAQLPSDILGRCRQQIIAYMTSETVLDTVLDCDNMITQLSTFRWGSVCENLVRDILDAGYAYIADHFASLVAADSFLSLGHDRSCHIPRLEGVLLRTASCLTPEQACRSYQRVTRLNTVLQANAIQMPANMADLAKELQGLQDEDLDWDPEYIRLVSAILSAVEQCLIRQCSRAMRCSAWQRMDLDLRKKVQTLARLTEPIEPKRNSTKNVPKTFGFSGNTRSHDLYQVKLAIQAHSKRALAADTQLYKATQTHGTGNVQTADRGVQANNEPKESTGKLLKSNTRVHVPQAINKAVTHSAIVSERNSINAHRRTQSSDAAQINVASTTAKSASNLTAVHKSASEQKQVDGTTAKVKRILDVRPRYLEPRKPRGFDAVSSGPVRSATTSLIPTNKNKGHHISSSESSRTSSPAARRTAAGRISGKASNMSLDNLVSPARRGRSATKYSDNERFSDVGVDSLGDSMKSSIITNKTISHESLHVETSGSQRSRSNPVITNSNKLAPPRRMGRNRSQINDESTKVNNAIIKVDGKPPKHRVTSTGSSPSSMNTTKSATSRLSSVSSTYSTRDMFKNRSISMPGQSAAATAGQSSTDINGQRYSFLSAKSREILAKRAEKNKQQQEQLQQLQQQQLQLQQEKLKQRNQNGQENEAPKLPLRKSEIEDVIKSPTKNRSGPQRANSHTTVNKMSTVSTPGHINNRNSLPVTSNIPTRRPNSLQIKKTNSRLNSINNNSTTTMAAATTNKKTKLINATNGVLKAAHQAVKQKIEMLIDTKSPLTDNNVITRVVTPSIEIETKLERSSTFCKETSDIDLNELQIIE